ncbi:MAG: hypothetical protein ACYC3X_16890 [Pirellulaceae bacterium]
MASPANGLGEVGRPPHHFPHCIEVCGDIEKLFDFWNQFSWHRVTVFGDVKEPLSEFGRALGLKVIEEA